MIAVDTPRDDYTKCVRERANTSINDLLPCLEDEPLYRRRSQSRSNATRRSCSLGRSTEHADYTYGAAVNKLRNMLDNHEPTLDKSVEFNQNHSNANTLYYNAESSATLMGRVPGPSETVALLKNQTAILSQNEAQKIYCMEEMHAMKTKMQSLVDENQELHAEITRGILTGVIDNDTDGIKVKKSFVKSNIEININDDENDNNLEVPEPTLKEMNKWRFELSRMSMLHTAKSTRMEVQLQHTKQELKESNIKLDDLRTQLRTQVSLRSTDPSRVNLSVGDHMTGICSMICGKCAENEAIVQSKDCTRQLQLDKISKERDDLITELNQLRSRHFDLRQIEEASYEQVRKGIEMVEQAQMEQTQAIVQKEQLKEQLLQMESRVTEHADKMALKMSDDRRFVRHEMQTEKDELELKLKEMSAALVENGSELERAIRDKLSAVSEYNKVKERSIISDGQHAEDLNRLNMSVTKAHIDRDETMREISKLKIDYDHLSAEFSQEKIRLQSSYDQSQRRLTIAEKSLVETREQLISLTNDNRKIERELNESRLARDHVERTRNDDLKIATHQYNSRESEMNATIGSIDAKYRGNITELEDMIQSQNQIVYKLQSECKFLNSKLEEATIKFRRDNKHLKAQNDTLRSRLDRQTVAVKSLESRGSQQSVVVAKLRDRIKLMDNHATNKGHEVLNLKGKESTLLQDRHLMQREIDYLRSQFNLDALSNSASNEKHIPLPTGEDIFIGDFDLPNSDLRSRLAEVIGVTSRNTINDDPLTDSESK